MTRGAQQNVDLFKMFMQTQMWKWQRTNLKVCVCGQKEEGHKKNFKYKTLVTKGHIIKKEIKICNSFKPGNEIGQIQGSLRPINLWEYVFPEECLDEVLTVLKVKSADTLKPTRAAMLRKALGKGVIPVPDYKDVLTNKWVQRNGVALYPIGIKKDPKKEYDWGIEGNYFQEGL